MSEWTNNNLEDVTIFIKDGTHGTHKDFPNGVPLLSAKDIENGKILIPEDCRTISESDYNQIHANYEIQTNDILLTIVGTIGRVAIVKNHYKKITFQRSVCIIRFNKTLISADYSFYFFQSNEFQKTLERAKNASAQGGVYLGSLAKANIYHPIEKAEQRQIARILSTCDGVIEKTQAAIAKYKAIKQGMLHDLFTRGIDLTTGKLRPKYEDAPELYKESKLGWIPKEWEEKEFDDACDFITDGSHFSPTPIEDGEIIINVKDMGEFGINYETCTRINHHEFTLLKSQNCSPRIGDVLLSKDGTIGRVVLFKDDREIVLLSSIAILRPSAKIIPEYLYSFLKSEYFDKQLLIKTSGSALKRIVLRDINTLFLVYPENNVEQEMISNRIIQIESKLQSEQTYLQKLQAIKQGLMSDLLSGRKRVKT